MKLTLVIAAVAAFGLSTSAYAKGKGKGAVTTNPVTATGVATATDAKTTATTTAQDAASAEITPAMESYATYQLAAADTNGNGTLEVAEATVLKADLEAGKIATSGIPLFSAPTVNGLQEAAVKCKN